MKRLMIQVAAAAVLASGLVGCKGGPGFNLPPMEQLMAPGPGVAGPGPGVMMASAAGPVGSEGMVGPAPTVQAWFAKPAGMQVVWDNSGSGDFSSTPLVVPARTNFKQAGLYRAKLMNIPGHEGMELYPSVEIGPANARTLAYLAHNAIPLQLTVDDFNQVMSGNFVTKVIYLPDPEFQELAVSGVETLVSTRLDPGVNPVSEADRRGSIMAILRLGNKDIEMPGMAPEALGYFGSLGRGGGGGGAVGPGPGGPVYGMPFTGTPVGLAGPPHIPLGGPAGLQKHVMRNHTHHYAPKPTAAMKIHVKQQPGVRYPAPRDRAFIREYNHPTCNRCGGNGCQECGSGMY